MGNRFATFAQLAGRRAWFTRSGLESLAPPLDCPTMETENAALEALRSLAGEWMFEMRHRLLPDPVLSGRSTFELLEGGKFLVLREQVQHADFPDSSLAVIGGADELRMHYFDSR